MRRLYVICFASLVTIFLTCYGIGCYVIAKGNREMQPVRDFYEVREAALPKNQIVKRDTELIVEEYDIDTGNAVRHTEVPQIAVLGLDRAGYAGTLRRYMNAPDDEDVMRGLISIDLVEFTTERIVIRKNYNVPHYSKTENFILCALDGRVVVYYEDFMTIYDYTDIKVSSLSIDLQREIYEGKQIKTLEELYDFLEDHTS